MKAAGRVLTGENGGSSGRSSEHLPCINTGRLFVIQSSESIALASQCLPHGRVGCASIDTMSQARGYELCDKALKRLSGEHQ